MGVESPTARDVVSNLDVGELNADELDPGEFEERRTGRWYGVSVFALVALGVGVLFQRPSLLFASAIGVGLAGYGQLTTPPAGDVAVERAVSDPDPDEGDEVTVTVTVRNEGDRTAPDLRVVDGVPPHLTVQEGSPRHATALRPGATTSFSYTVTARRGSHQFRPATVLARDVSGATERASRVETETTIACEPRLPETASSFPLRPKTSQYTGRFPADSGGPGVEFYATREYRVGDPLSRIDWNRTARTGEFTTVEYRVERTVTAVLLVDARRAASLASDPDQPSAVDRGVDAAREAYVSLTREGHDVGVSALSSRDCWLEPGNGPDHRVRARALFGSHEALSPVRDEAETNVFAALQTLKQRLPGDAQVLLFSPLCDEHVVASAIRLDAYGYPTTVVSPDPTSDETTGGRVARVRRRLRMANLRQRGIPVVDWDGDTPLERAVARSQRRGSR